MLWVGTEGGGLDRWDAAERRAGQLALRHYTERQGLPNNVVYALLPDERGFVWASTNRGLARLDPASGSLRTFDTSHGLPGDEFNYGAAHRSAKGEMFFGGTNGFVSFFPGLLRSNEHVPPVVLTGVSKLNRPVSFPRPLSEVEAVEIGWRDHFFSFEFAALDFTTPEKNRYAYRLDGFDRDWIDSGSIRRATYTNVAPGSYTFRVRAANDDGVWNEQGLALRVRVVPPPWRTPWAYGAYVLAVGAALVAWQRSQQRRLAREAEYSHRLEREVEERTAELAASNRQLQDANRRFEEASVTDSLTGLHNRRYLLTEIEGALALAERQRLTEPEHPSSCLFLMVDLDGFKQLNDAHGHRAGDEALRQVTALLREACRRSDVIVRWGGDEFLVLGRETDRAGGAVLAERIVRAVAGAPVRGRGRPSAATLLLGRLRVPPLRDRRSRRPRLGAGARGRRPRALRGEGQRTQRVGRPRGGTAAQSPRRCSTSWRVAPTRPSRAGSSACRARWAPSARSPGAARPERSRRRQRAGCAARTSASTFSAGVPGEAPPPAERMKPGCPAIFRTQARASA